MADKKKKKPKFNVLNAGFKKRVKSRWRKPRGTHNKKRIGFKWTGASPCIGYKNPDSIRGLHPNGTVDVLVNNLMELDGLKEKGVSVRIASTIGAKKRVLMEEKAAKLKLKVVNMHFGKKSDVDADKKPKYKVISKPGKKGHAQKQIVKQNQPVQKPSKSVHDAQASHKTLNKK
ncbi:eL32 family ribosomal protein [Candidatus Micrarchaeota archaeon]|nr:eL32 family ribosomal protein [Candidatus Micrarchaeota archaeon]MBU1165937.1 eL32 family ribosomal protein [Candidatus Micrarchaeota archaeon]MBU1886841.1 eL32 family ribosomal protein [Candidatus Micrarchaeota archaeon]